MANGLLQKARAGCKTSSIFYLKKQAGWRETAEVAHVVEAEGDGFSAKDKLKEFLDNIAARSSRIGVDSYTDRQLEAVIANGQEAVIAHGEEDQDASV